MNKQPNPPANKNKEKTKDQNSKSYSNFENIQYNDDIENGPEFDLEEGYDDYEDDNLEDGEDF